MELRSGRRLCHLSAVISHDAPADPSTSALSAQTAASPHYLIVNGHQRDPHLFAGLLGEDVQHWLDGYGRVPVLLAIIAAESQALHHHQPSIQPGYGSPGYSGQAAPDAASYPGYGASQPQPYSFRYHNFNDHSNRYFGSEHGDSNGARIGSYGNQDVSGLYQRDNHVADAYGFRADVGTNQPGQVPGARADAVFIAVPAVQPVQLVAAQSGIAGGFVAGTAASYSSGGYNGYGDGEHNPSVGPSGNYEYAAYDQEGQVASAQTLAGYAYGGQLSQEYADAGYAAGYAPGSYGVTAAYVTGPWTHHTYRRR